MEEIQTQDENKLCQRGKSTPKSHFLDELAKEATSFEKILALLMAGMAKRLVPIRSDRKSGGRATIGTARTDTYKR